MAWEIRELRGRKPRRSRRYIQVLFESKGFAEAELRELLKSHPTNSNWRNVLVVREVPSNSYAVDHEWSLDTEDLQMAEFKARMREYKRARTVAREKAREERKTET